jgi:PhzF family phenazine biosynthesis protein
MRALPIFQIDAFTGERFKGNPAGVCILKEPIDDKYMQLIAGEMNLPETAFVRPADGKSIHESGIFSLRWFTPECEVSLCGHGTLGTSEILYSHLGNINTQITFETKSGRLTSKRCGSGIALDFPLDEPLSFDVSTDILKAMGIDDYENAVIGKKTRKLVIQLKEQTQIYELNPDFGQMKKINFKTDIKGIGVTCRGRGKYDFVSRYFNPWAGVNEDPVTGSVHTLLAAYWGSLLNKSEMKAYQASKRGGEILLRVGKNDRVELIGQSVITLRGEVYLPD